MGLPLSLKDEDLLEEQLLAEEEEEEDKDDPSFEDEEEEEEPGENPNQQVEMEDGFLIVRDKFLYESKLAPISVKKPLSILSHLPIPNSFYYEWEAVTARVLKPEKKFILEPQSGFLRAGQMLAVVGSRNAGKTTLLKYLSGYIEESIDCHGYLKIGGVEGLTMKELRSLCGFVVKEDTLNQELTVKETLEYSASLRLPIYMEAEERMDRVHEVIELMNLGDVVSRKIGGELDMQELSKLKRKQAIIGAELIRDSAIIMLDEPTVGLESLDREKLIGVLRKVSQMGKIVMVAMEQPSVEILQQFDKILMLHQGRKVYMGNYKGVRKYFKKHQIKIPKSSNHVEFVLNNLEIDPYCSNVIKRNCDLKTAYLYKRKNKIYLKKIIEENKRNVEVNNLVDNNQDLINELIVKSKKSKRGFRTSFPILYKKYWKIYFRNPKGFSLRAKLGAAQLLYSSFFYWQMTYDERNIQNRKGLLYVVMMYTALSSLQIAAFTLGNDRALLEKELKEGNYSPSAYFYGKTLAPLLPSIAITLIVSNVIHVTTNMNRVDYAQYLYYNSLILIGMLCSESIGILFASIAGTSERTMTLLPFIVTPLSLFAGLIVDLDSISNVLLPFKYNFFRFFYEGLITNEFDGLNGCKDGICDVPEKEMGFGMTPYGCLLVLACIGIGSRLLAWLVIVLKYLKFRGLD
jgi:ABC-type multidrug transport system ATPase subunit